MAAGITTFKAVINMLSILVVIYVVQSHALNLSCVLSLAVLYMQFMILSHVNVLHPISFFLFF